MSLTKRLLARLDVKGNKLIKGVRYEGLRVIGDPYAYAHKYVESGVDEIIYLDVVASLYGRNSLFEVLQKTSSNIFIPITAGGGIRSVEDAARLLSYGADKIAINTAALAKPELVFEISQAFGSQAVVVSIQARRKTHNSWICMTEAGREKSDVDVLDWIKQVQRLGAGEILLTSVDNDGTKKQPDQNLINAAQEIVDVPLVVSGGFSDNHQIRDSLILPGVTGVACGASFHYNIIKPTTVKDYLQSCSIKVRPNETIPTTNLFKYKSSSTHLLSKVIIGIIDYNMGNHQSLVNAFNFLGFKTIITSKISKLDSCDLLILPGVGSFSNGIKNLINLQLDSFIHDWTSQHKPFIGICLGMQLLFDSSEEYGFHRGLGLIPGTVRKIQIPPISSHESFALPHTGWNVVMPNKDINSQSYQNKLYQYFVHSYTAVPLDPSTILHTTTYAHQDLVATVKSQRIVGFQFHPERSGNDGVKLLWDTLLLLFDQ